MTNEEYVQDWINKAEKDIKTVEIMREYNDLTEIICFHCQQAVEKYLKALLIKNDEDITKTHNIDFLLNKCFKYNNKFEDFLGTALSEYAVDTRYPDIRYIPSKEEMEDAISQMKEIIKIVKGCMK